MHILVVDDERIIREGAERILLKEGWQATAVENGERGLECLENNSFNILLLDLMMPGISGMEVLKAIRETHPKLLVIVITGYATIENAVEAMKNGAYDFIPKPFTPDQLRIVIRRAIEKLTLEQEAERLRLEREKSLQDIADEKSRTRTIISHMADGVVVTDRQGTVVLNNPAVTRLLGLEGEPPQGKNISEWISNDHLTEMIQEVLNVENPHGQGISREIAWGDSPRCFFTAHSAPVRNEQGEVLGAVTIFNDVTCFKELDQMKSDFVNMVSHELRSPLSSVQQQLYNIVNGISGEINEEQNRILGRVQGRIDGLITMVRNLLDLSRVESGSLVQHKEKVALEEIIQGAVELLAQEAEKKSLTLDVKIDSQLFPVHADRQSMETVFTNLLGNAIKYNQDNGSIFVNARNRGEFVEVQVSDTGVGIKQDNLARIFDKFYRIRTEYTRKVIGSGLGLPLVKALVEAHLGTITVESKEGEGTTFTVLLPRGLS